MMTVGVIGLGLIGGSLAKAVHEADSFKVYGTDANPKVVDMALSEGTLAEELNKDNAKDCDLFIVALYPKDVAAVIRYYSSYMKKGAIVVDCTGVKSKVCADLSKYLADKDIHFVGGHPMAGKEVAGYENAESSMFSNASMILCRDEYTDEDAFKKMHDFFLSIGFKRIKETTPKEHDAVIAYTSQMAHVISNAYIKSDTLHNRYGFSAGSFKDLTRVAYLNEYMWTDLFLENKDSLLKEIDTFMENMSKYRDALANENKEELIKLLGRGRELKEEDNNKENQMG